MSGWMGDSTLTFPHMTFKALVHKGWFIMNLKKFQLQALELVWLLLRPYA